MRWLAALVLAYATTALGNPLVAMIGDSTTWGFNLDASKEDPALMLHLALVRTPGAGRWRYARIRNLGAPGSGALDWIAPPGTENGCAFAFRSAIATYACAHDVPFVDAIPTVLGRMPDVALVTLGTNDVNLQPTAQQVGDWLMVLEADLAPTRVLMAPPFPRLDAHADWPGAVRIAMIERGLLTGPDRPVLPTAADGLHLTRGGYVASAGFWLDALLTLR